MFTETIGPDVLALSAAMERIGIPQDPPRRGLPVVNVPDVDQGIAKFQADGITPSFNISSKAKELYDEWGVPSCLVDTTTGDVKEPVPSPLPGDLPMVKFANV